MCQRDRETEYEESLPPGRWHSSSTAAHLLPQSNYMKTSRGQGEASVFSKTFLDNTKAHPGLRTMIWEES